MMTEPTVVADANPGHEVTMDNMQATIDRLTACAVLAGFGVDSQGYYVGTPGFRVRALEAVASAAQAWEESGHSDKQAAQLSEAVAFYRYAEEAR